MKIFLQYLKEKRLILIAAFVTPVLYDLVMYLFKMPFNCIMYPTVLTLFVLLVALGVDFGKTYGKHKEWEESGFFADGGEGSDSSVITDGGSVLEIDLKKKIARLERKISETNTNWENKYQGTVDYFTAWAHQIKTPIASMRLALEGMDSEQGRHLSSELGRIERYVDMVMVYLRLDSESSDYVFKKQELDPLLRQTIRRFAKDFIGKKLSLTYEPIAFEIITDEKWFQFCLEQLISNAVKYTKKGGITITLEENRYLCIADTGIGIAPEDLPRIFERGFTGYNGRLDKKASGIGLYLCKRICDGLKIGIDATSEPERGTTIRLDLAQYDLKKE